MANVEVAESLKYGFKLFVYLLGVVVLGGGGMVLGGALAGPELLDGSVTDSLSSPELLGGVVLAVLGLGVWFTGTFGLLYKLLADAVQRGVPTGAEPAPTPSREASEQPTPQMTRPPAEPVGRSPGEQAARQFGPGPTVSSAADVPDRANPSVSISDRGTEPATTAESPVESGGPGSETASSQEGPPDRGPADDTAGAARKQDDVLADQGEPADDQKSDAGPTERAEVGKSDDDETSTAEADDTATERTAEEIAFGTAEDDADDRPEPNEQESGTEQGKPAPEIVGDDEGETPPGEGAIPPYEEMDGAEPTEGIDEQEPFPETDTASSGAGDSDDRASDDVTDDTELSSEEPAPDEGEASDWGEQPSTATGGDDPLSSTSGDDPTDALNETEREDADAVDITEDEQDDEGVEDEPDDGTDPLSD